MKDLCYATLVVLSTAGPLPASAADLNFELVKDPHAIKVAVAGLQHDWTLNVGGGHISSCDPITSENFGRGFTALGAACHVKVGQTTSKWIICTDDGIGNFVAEVGVTWQTGPSLHLPTQVATFAHTYCAHG